MSCNPRLRSMSTRRARAHGRGRSGPETGTGTRRCVHRALPRLGCPAWDHSQGRTPRRLVPRGLGSMLCSVRFGEATGPSGDAGGRGHTTCCADAGATLRAGSFPEEGGLRRRPPAWRLGTLVHGLPGPEATVLLECPLCPLASVGAPHPPGRAW